MDHRSTRYPRGKVTEAQDRCLQVLKPFLMTELESRELVPRLRSKFILDDNDEQYIFSGETRKEKNGRLVDTVTKRTSRGFQEFKQALYDTGHDHAYNKLQWEQTKQESCEVLDATTHHATDPETPAPEDKEKVVSLQGQVENLADAVETVSVRVEILEDLKEKATKDDDGRQREIEQLKNELNDAWDQVDQLRRENEALAGLVHDRSQQLKGAEARVKQLEQKIAEAEEKARQLEHKIADLEKEKKDMQDDIRYHAKKLKQVERQMKLHKEEAEKHSTQMKEQMKQQKSEVEKLAKMMEKQMKQQREDAEKLLQAVAKYKPARKSNTESKAGGRSCNGQHRSKECPGQEPSAENFKKKVSLINIDSTRKLMFPFQK